MGLGEGHKGTFGVWVSFARGRGPRFREVVGSWGRGVLPSYTTLKPATDDFEGAASYRRPEAVVFNGFLPYRSSICNVVTAIVIVVVGVFFRVGAVLSKPSVILIFNGLAIANGIDTNAISCNGALEARLGDTPHPGRVELWRSWEDP
ncbi:hypothetical protein PIB30_047697 [Stylosanthes scabra]|uniref:Uncharacterized protein n=1 Tax=Stylosanthes scabra TaxID=79078 RepID=A0ABU6QGJ2_9FABA|nr:hypothetical protein [Stylosanthes scabra]